MNSIMDKFKPEDEDSPFANWTPHIAMPNQEINTVPIPAPTSAPMAPNVAPASIAPIQPKSPSAALPGQLPGMPPSIGPDELEKYLGTQKQSLDKYGPEVQMGAEKKSLEDRNSFSSRLTGGLKGFADALMTGVAGAENPHWQDQYERRQDEQAKEKMDVLKNADEGNDRRVKTNMSLDEMDAKSVLSKQKQMDVAPLFEKLGFPADSLKGMSGANIENTLKLMTEYGTEAQKAAVMKYQADQTLGETSRHNKEMEGIGHMGQEETNRKLRVEHPISSYFLGGESSDPSASRGPYGNTVERGGKTYQWSPLSGKYHPVN